MNYIDNKTWVHQRDIINVICISGYFYNYKREQTWFHPRARMQRMLLCQNRPETGCLNWVIRIYPGTFLVFYWKSTNQPKDSTNTQKTTTITINNKTTNKQKPMKIIITTTITIINIKWSFSKILSWKIALFIL